MQRWMVGLALVAVGCGGAGANCEVEVNGVVVCLDGVAMSYCRSDWGGEATRSDSSDDPTCRTLGYRVSCEGHVNEEGEGFSAEHPFEAASEEDCAAAADGQVGGV